MGNIVDGVNKIRYLPLPVIADGLVCMGIGFISGWVPKCLTVRVAPELTSK